MWKLLLILVFFRQVSKVNGSLRLVIIWPKIPAVLYTNLKALLAAIKMNDTLTIFCSDSDFRWLFEEKQRFTFFLLEEIFNSNNFKAMKKKKNLHLWVVSVDECYFLKSC